jgi:ABC-2 type transport system ATP-binding protein
MAGNDRALQCLTAYIRISTAFPSRTLMPSQSLAIEVIDLCKRYGDVAAVDGISFQVAKGSICALLGGNGAGKTTTLAMLLGLLLPTSGTIRILGADMVKNRFAVLPRMNFTSPYVDLPHRLTVEQNLEVYARLYGIRRRRERLRRLAATFDLEALWHRTYGSLSAGQRTRVALAKSLLNEPEVLLMDEPTASLDPASADTVRTWLEDYQRRTGATVLLASHNMQEVERLCREVVMLRQGRVVDRDTPEALVRKHGRDTLEEVFIDIARDAATL